jgi:hypothetical protein
MTKKNRKYYVVDPNQKSLLRSLLRILTPEEIDDLSKIYLTFFRKSLTALMDEKINLEKRKIGLESGPTPPPLSQIKRVRKKNRDIPPFLDSKPIGGVIFYLDEKEKFKEIFKKQKKLRSTYQKNVKVSGKDSKGILVNKKCA